MTLLTLVPVSAAAQSNDLNRALRRVRDNTDLLQAVNNLSDLCSGYVGRVVAPVTFSALAARLSGPPAKKEFETAAQYKARVSAITYSIPTSPVVLSVPVDRDYVTYDADRKSLWVSAGAITSGYFSDDKYVEVDAQLFLIPAGVEPGLAVPHSANETLIRTYTAHSGLGTAVKVSEIARRSNGLYLTSQRLFPFARDEDSPVMDIEAPAPRARLLKQSLRLALAVIPKAPYVFRAEQDSPAPTLRNPVQYQDKLTAIYAEAKCALALDSQGRVLASADTAE